MNAYQPVQKYAFMQIVYLLQPFRITSPKSSGIQLRNSKQNAILSTDCTCKELREKYKRNVYMILSLESVRLFRPERKIKERI